jgi:hypothetical protein
MRGRAGRGRASHRGVRAEYDEIGGRECEIAIAAPAHCRRHRSRNGDRSSRNSGSRRNEEAPSDRSSTVRVRADLIYRATLIGVRLRLDGATMTFLSPKGGEARGEGASHRLRTRSIALPGKQSAASSQADGSGCADKRALAGDCSTRRRPNNGGVDRWRRQPLKCEAYSSASRISEPDRGHDQFPVCQNRQSNHDRRIYDHR